MSERTDETLAAVRLRTAELLLQRIADAGCQAVNQRRAPVRHVSSVPDTFGILGL